VTDVLQPIGFWSYTSSDDTAARGKLSLLRALLNDELQLKIGRSQTVKIFQDVAAIKHGEDWEKAIHAALDQSSFLIPIITPAFLESEWCCREVLHFHARAQALGRDDLIFPVHYVDSDPDRVGVCHDPEALAVLRRHQWIDFRALRIRNPDSEAVAAVLDTFTDSIRDALRRAVAPAPPPPRVPPVVAVRAEPPKPGSVIKDGPDLPEMVLIPAGRFTMGVPEAESRREEWDDGDARPLTQIEIAEPFYMGRTPVTRGQFAAFVRDAGYEAGYRWERPGFEQTDDHPVVNVHHYDALAYIDWVNGRTEGGYSLPSEAAWEYAARARTRTARYWGDDFKDAARYAWSGRTTGTAPVALWEPNRFGLYDMLGNVWEWCADLWHDSYAGRPTDASVWKRGGENGTFVLRGGSWNGYSRNARAGTRLSAGDSTKSYDFGFRLCRTLFPPAS
jgi:formylglycine-generating enzyme required for sulfatase activity